MSEAALLRTPLYDRHVSLGGKVIPFAGWEMPVQYTGIVQEHHAVRKAVGVFDISHMGQFLVRGKKALAFLNRALTNDVANLALHRGQYSLLLNEHGGVIDDLILYRFEEDAFFVVVNASKISEDWEQLQSLQSAEAEAEAEVEVEGEVEMVNLSAETAGLAIQGPLSRKVFETVMGTTATFPERNTIAVVSSDAGAIWLCGTGYTGEEGFEIFVPASVAEAWFDRFVSAAREEGGQPCGLGARDTLRLEMGYPLNGNDLAPDKTPLEAGLGFFVAMDKGDFIGKSALLAQKTAGLPSRLAAFKMTGTAPPPRPHYPVHAQGAVIGEVASGTLSPSLGCGIGMAYLPLAQAKIGTPIEIEIRGRLFPAEVVKKPFYQKA